MKENKLKIRSSNINIYSIIGEHLKIYMLYISYTKVKYNIYLIKA